VWEGETQDFKTQDTRQESLGGRFALGKRGFRFGCGTQGGALGCDVSPRWGWKSPKIKAMGYSDDEANEAILTSSFPDNTASATSRSQP